MNKISFFIILSIMAITSSNLKEPALIGDNNFIEAFDKEYIAIKEFLIPFSKAFRDNPQKIRESKMNVLDEIAQVKMEVCSLIKRIFLLKGHAQLMKMRSKK